jgi:hypothetical protein
VTAVASTGRAPGLFERAILAVLLRTARAGNAALGCWVKGSGHGEWSTFFLLSNAEISNDARSNCARSHTITEKGAKDLMMSRSNQWICLAGGIFLFLLGVKRLFQEGDWVIVILGVLILAFSTSSIVKGRQKS